jgi:hypothetical protein
MNEKRAFWIIATVVALAGISAAVAYFVTRYLRAQTCEELLDDYCDCDYGYDYDCDCDYDCGCDTEEPATEEN